MKKKRGTTLQNDSHETLLHGIDFFAQVFWLYKYIRIYSLITIHCNFFQIYNETFFFIHNFFPIRVSRKYGVFL